MKNKTVFVACDTSNLNKVKKIISQIKSKKSFIIARSYKSPAIKMNENEPLKTVG